MPSPFPGMDPYLEGRMWMGVHAQLIAEIARQLAPLLRPRYLALTGERVVLATPDEIPSGPGFYPDVGVSRGSDRPMTESGRVAAAPLLLKTVFPEAIPQYTVEIRDTDERRLVTAIEVLSPTNKRGDGRSEYLVKRGTLLRSTSHLLEIDLLRTGQRVPMAQPLPPAPYFVLLSRVERRPVSEVWAVGLRQPLPTVLVPLLNGDADVPLDLQKALTTVYDALGYDLAIDYDRPPEVPLSPEDDAWAAEALRQVRSGPPAN